MSEVKIDGDNTACSSYQPCGTSSTSTSTSNPTSRCLDVHSIRQLDCRPLSPAHSISCHPALSRPQDATQRLRVHQRLRWSSIKQDDAASSASSLAGRKLHTLFISSIYSAPSRHYNSPSSLNVLPAPPNDPFPQPLQPCRAQHLSSRPSRAGALSTSSTRSRLSRMLRSRRSSPKPFFTFRRPSTRRPHAWSSC